MSTKRHPTPGDVDHIKRWNTRVSVEVMRRGVRINLPLLEPYLSVVARAYLDGCDEVAAVDRIERLRALPKGE